MTASAQLDQRPAAGHSGRRLLLPAPRGGTAGTRSWHRRDIEGLRAVAVLLVVLYHCGVPFVAGGYVGVDVFFVISGFLITSLLLRELASRGRIGLAGFYARRALRLLPAASLVIVATVVASALWLPPLRRGSILLDALHTMGYAINYRLAAGGIDYLGALEDPSPLQHFWSLAVEEQFYLVWAPLLLVTALAGRRRPVLAVVGGLVAVSFVASVWQTAANPTWAYFGAHTRAWELGAGALVAAAASRFDRLPRAVALSLAAAGLLAVVAAAVRYTDATAFPGYAALLPVGGAAAILIGGCSVRSPWLSGAPLQVLGRLSYSWYLWHWPFLTIAPFALDRSLGLPGKLLVAAAALGAAQLTYVLVENPVRNVAALRRVPWRGLAAGLVTSAVAAGLCVVATARLGPDAEPRSTYVAAPLVPAGMDPAHLAAVVAQSAVAPAVPRNLVPRLAKAKADSPRLYADGCSGGTLDAAVKTPCAYGDLNSPTTVVLYGDSHAGHWFPALEKIAQVRHFKLVVVTKGACHAADNLVYLSYIKRTFTECVAWRHAAWQRIRSLRPAAIVMVSSIVANPLANSAQLGSNDAIDEAWTAGWMRSVDQIGSTGAKLFYLNDTPYYPAVVPECLSSHLNDPAACPQSAARVIQQPHRRGLIGDAMRRRGVTVIDPLPWFCTATTCPTVIGNVLVYKDGHHVTTEYSRLLAPLLMARLRW